VPGTAAAAAWSGDWIVALPLKRLARAKSRLLLPSDVRASVALAMALDTAAAALDCPVVSAVLVICGEDAAPSFEDLGCRVLPDPGQDELNEVLGTARQLARAADPTAAFASLVADLPALRPGDLAAALVEAGQHPRSYVSDAAGTGTTLLAALPGAVYAPSYGAASSHRHRAGGATPLEVPASSPLRRDVDTLTDLGRASAGGVGPRTARLLGTVLDRPVCRRAGGIRVAGGCSAVAGRALGARSSTSPAIPPAT
jgi:2-phospho-L-lactate guanylyltransferase